MKVLKQAASLVLAALIVATLMAAFGGMMYVNWRIQHTFICK